MKKLKQIGRVSSASVSKATGKNWDQWIQILNKAGAQSWTHQEIVAFLKKEFKLSPWWQQGVTLGFEIAIGRRVEGQNAKGEYSVTVTKSLPIDAQKTWRMLVSKGGMKLWLKPLYPVAVKAGSQFETEDGFFGEFRTLKREDRVSRIRLTWQDPNWEKKSTVQITFVNRPNGKSILVFDHSGIKNTKIQAQMRMRWKEAALNLYESLS